MRKRHRSTRTWLGLSLTVLAVIALMVAGGRAREAGAWAIVKAPNYVRAAHPAPAPRDVSRVIRAEVGPPAAVLEAWILDPERVTRRPRSVGCPTMKRW